MALNVELLVRTQATLTSVLDLVTADATLKNNQEFTWTDGAGADKAEEVFSDQRTINASTTDSLDLSGTALTNAFGVDIAFTKIKAIIIKSATANGSTLTVSCPASDGFTGLFLTLGEGIKIRPGGVFVIIAPDATGYPVSGTSPIRDQLDIINDDSSSPGTATYDIIIIGETT